MPSSQKSSKAQFFVLSAIIIVTAAYSLSRAYFMKKLPVENLVSDELFIVQNLNIIYNRTANVSKDCLMFKYNVEEVSQFLQNELEKMGYDVNITTIPVRICSSGQSEMIVDFKLRSSLLEIEKNMTVRWPSTYP